MLSETGNDRKLLAVFLDGIELVGKSRFELLASDVGKLGFCDE